MFLRYTMCFLQRRTSACMERTIGWMFVSQGNGNFPGGCNNRLRSQLFRGISMGKSFVPLVAMKASDLSASVSVAGSLLTGSCLHIFLPVEVEKHAFVSSISTWYVWSNRLETTGILDLQTLGVWLRNHRSHLFVKARADAKGTQNKAHCHRCVLKLVGLW